MKDKPLQTFKGNCHAEFGLSREEIQSCTLCGYTEPMAIEDYGFAS